MLRVPIQRARPGMILAVDVRHPITGRRLLGRGYHLDGRLLPRLAKLEVHELWIEYPEFDSIHRYISPAIVRQHGKIVSMMAELFAHLHADAWARLDFVPYRRAMSRLIETMAVNDDAMIYVTELGGGTASALRHASEVSFLSLLLGLRLRDYIINERPRLSSHDAVDLVPLGLGGLLHDIGLELIGCTARRQFLAGHGDDNPEVRQHVRLGYDLIVDHVPPSAATVVLNHHQRWDGSGYPVVPVETPTRGLTGRRPHVFARIAAVADQFDRLRYCESGRALPRVIALRKMLSGPMARRFDPTVLAALPTVVPAYAPGTVVGLSDGCHAVVVDWTADAPCRPKVRPVNAPVPVPGESDPHVIDLQSEPNLIIVEQDGLDVRAANFQLRSSRPAAWTSERRDGTT